MRRIKDSNITHKQWLRFLKRNCAMVTNTNFPIPISMQPDVRLRPLIFQTMNSVHDQITLNFKYPYE